MHFHIKTLDVVTVLSFLETGVTRKSRSNPSLLSHHVEKAYSISINRDQKLQVRPVSRPTERPVCIAKALPALRSTIMDDPNTRRGDLHECDNAPRPLHV